MSMMGLIAYLCTPEPLGFSSVTFTLFVFLLLLLHAAWALYFALHAD